MGLDPDNEYVKAAKKHRRAKATIASVDIDEVCAFLYIRHKLSYQDIANLTGLAYNSVPRCIHRWQQRKEGP